MPHSPPPSSESGGECQLWRDYSASTQPAMEQYRETMLIIGRWLFGSDSRLLDDPLPFRHIALDQLAQSLGRAAGGDQSLLGQCRRDRRGAQEFVDDGVVARER